jgi:membrane-bound lytic murein transglycosylase B
MSLIGHKFRGGILTRVYFTESYGLIVSKQFSNRGEVLKVFLFLTQLLWATVTHADQAFNEYLQEVTGQALSEGVSQATIDKAFKDLQQDPRVIGYDRKQPEFVQTFDEYLDARVTDFRIREARRLSIVHESLLRQVSRKYQVGPQYIVAFWGLETSFGKYQGKYSIIRSLATLGFDPRRSGFFTAELIKALQILDEGHVPLDQFVGAWAGAMGQGQFLPSSFLNYAVDFDEDGRKDVWANEADVFASIANYLQKNGWQQGAGWGARVGIDLAIDFETLREANPGSRCRALKHHTRKMSLESWRDMGLSPRQDLEKAQYALVIPGQDQGSSYLVGGNFRTILSYNCANKYAVSVGLLADLIANPGSS